MVKILFNPREYSKTCFCSAINEYCTDAAVCEPLSRSPLYGAACPIETPTAGW